jgi:Asp-tRNA(Asn)/Glu-tRNA(Gln) amidotransferase A subunit family amidase
MPLFATLVSAAEALRARRVSAPELLRDVLDRIARDDRFIRAYSDLMPEVAGAEAKAAELRFARGEPLGPLDGVPVAIKDLIDTTPAICRAGLPQLAEYRPGHDADVVAQLRRAGAVIIGVLETDAGAFGTRTPQVINPIAPDLIAGGSSGGPGAAVCAGFAYGAIGTDTGGSIRIPAACCSVAGLKPTWGRVSAKGVRPLAQSCDHVGPLARSVADLQAIQAVLDPPQEAAPTPGLRIGTASDYFADADPLVLRAMAHVTSALAEARHRIVDLRLPIPDDIMDSHMVTVTHEAARYHTEQFPGLWQAHPDIARDGIELGRTFSDEDYARAQAKRRRIAELVEGLFETVDILILPTLPMDAPAREADTVSLRGHRMPVLDATIRYTALFNHTGHPVVSIPAFGLADGRALSVQIVGARHSDQRLLAMARHLEDIFAVTVNYEDLVRAAQMDVRRLRRH